MTFEEWWKTKQGRNWENKFVYDSKLSYSASEIAIAREAWEAATNASGGGYHALRIELEHLRAALEEEREACARVCEKLRNLYMAEGRPAQEEAFLIAATMDCEQAIRNR